MAAWGFSFGEMEEKEVELWPESWVSFILFESISTQWRVGMGGAIGLDYQTIPLAAKYLEINDEEMPYVFRDVRIMEGAVLKQMADERAKNAK
jgi:hypothetical protein